jgi:radical SAM family RiPP maturation amino acid epimerase
MRDSFRRRGAPDHPRFARWRQRQVDRVDGQLSAGTGPTMVHSPFCFELSKGCSVGCAFCGVDAPKLSAIFHYTEENRRLWRDLLHVANDIGGAATQSCFCYWATDPLDNPDYERFCIDFDELTGAFPVTTTALALKDSERTRAFLRLASDRGCFITRFSVLSVAMMARIHRTFTPEELLHTECPTMNPESEMVKANAGRFRERALADRSLLDRERKKLERKTDVLEPGRARLATMPDAPETIACVSGFLVNMVDRTVKLVSPCAATDRWPLGYMIFDERTFTTAADFRHVVEEMIEARMPESVDDHLVVRFRPDLRYEPTDDGFDLVAASHRVRFRNATSPAYLRALGDAIHGAARPAGVVALTTFYETGVPAETTMSTFDLMLSKGVLDEEPRTARRGR